MLPVRMRIHKVSCTTSEVSSLYAEYMYLAETSGVT